MDVNVDLRWPEELARPDERMEADERVEADEGRFKQFAGAGHVLSGSGNSVPWYKK